MNSNWTRRHSVGPTRGRRTIGEARVFKYGSRVILRITISSGVILRLLFPRRRAAANQAAEAGVNGNGAAPALDGGPSNGTGATPLVEARVVRLWAVSPPASRFYAILKTALDFTLAFLLLLL